MNNSNQFFILLSRLLLVFLVLSLGACVSTKQQSKASDFQSMTVLQTDEDTKLAFVKQEYSGARFCAPREGDVADSRAAGIGLGVNTAREDDTVEFKNTQRAVALGGRSPEVLLTRELLYRACELAMNTNAGPTATLAIYEDFLVAIEAMSKKQVGLGTGVKDSASALDVNFDHLIQKRRKRPEKPKPQPSPKPQPVQKPQPVPNDSGSIQPANKADASKQISSNNAASKEQPISPKVSNDTSTTIHAQHSKVKPVVKPVKKKISAADQRDAAAQKAETKKRAEEQQEIDDFLKSSKDENSDW